MGQRALPSRAGGAPLWFSGAVEAGRVPVAVIAVLTSAVGAFYYLRVLMVMYRRPGGMTHSTQ